MTTTTEQTTFRRYTTAPADYDGFSTREITANAGENCGKTVRLVEIGERDLQWQTMRYGSGMHAAFDGEQWRELVDAGLATETPAEPAVVEVNVDAAAQLAKVAEAAFELFDSTIEVKRGKWQVDNSRMRSLVEALEAAGFNFEQAGQ